MKLYRNVVSVLFFALAVYVFVLNLVCTCFTSADRFEINYFTGDIVILNVVALALFGAGVVFLGKTKVSGFLEKNYKVLRIALLVLIGVTGVVFAISCGLKSGVDQLYVQRSVDELRRGVNDSFQPTNYMDIYPNQYGYALLTYLLSFVAGTYNYLVIRLINVAFLVLLYSELQLAGRQAGLGRAGEIMVLILGFLFLPTTLYALFIYGNIPGLALAVMAVRFMVDAFQKKRKYLGIISVVLIFLSCVFKSNHMIFAVAIGIYCLFKGISIKDYKKLIYIPCLIAAVWLSSFIPKLVMKNLTGLPLNGGVNYASYLAMGIQENSPNYPGGFNGFNEDSYRMLGGDSKAHGEYSMEVYKQILSEMVSDPTYMLNFFTRKQLHQWADPVYKSYWSVQSVAQDNTALWFNSFIGPKAEYPVVIIFSFFQIFVWFGAVLYVWLKNKNEHFEEALIMPLIFIGGFIFHTFGEAKSQYVFPYFVILFPVSILGWSALSQWYWNKDRKPVKESIAKLKNSTITWNFSFTLASVAVIFLLGEVVGVATMREQFAQDGALYKQYITTEYRQSHNPLDEGRYVISSGDLSYDVYAVNRGDKTLLKSCVGDMYLTASITGQGVGTLEFKPFTGAKEQAFKLYMTTDGKIIIVYNDDYVFAAAGDEVKVYEVPFGTLIWSDPNEGRKWDCSRIE